MSFLRRYSKNISSKQIERQFNTANNREREKLLKFIIWRGRKKIENYLKYLSEKSESLYE